MKTECPLCKAPFACSCAPYLSTPVSEQSTSLRMMVSYIGDNFSGFQAQDSVRTVEGELAKAILVVTGQQVKIHAAGRTDAGVHARGQVVSIQLITRLTPRQLTLALASKLPPDMSVWRIDKMPLSFDARRQSVGKQYIYRIFQGLVADPFFRNALLVRKPLDVVAMAAAAQFFLGEHDFISFRSSLCSSAHAVRYIWHVGLEKIGPLIEIDVRGNAFCLNMVRIMAGTLIEVGMGKRMPYDVRSALLGKNRRLAGITAKAHALTLERVFYPDDLRGALIPSVAIFPRYPVSSVTWHHDQHEIVYGPS